MKYTKLQLVIAKIPVYRSNFMGLSSRVKLTRDRVWTHIREGNHYYNMWSLLSIVERHRCDHDYPTVTEHYSTRGENWSIDWDRQVCSKCGTPVTRWR